VSGEPGVAHGVDYAELAEERFDAGVQRLAGAMAREPLPLDQDDTQSAPSAPERRRRSSWPAADDDDIHCGIGSDVSHRR